MREQRLLKDLKMCGMYLTWQPASQLLLFPSRHRCEGQPNPIECVIPTMVDWRLRRRHFFLLLVVFYWKTSNGFLAVVSQKRPPNTGCSRSFPLTTTTTNNNNLVDHPQRQHVRLLQQQPNASVRNNNDKNKNNKIQNHSMLQRLSNIQNGHWRKTIIGGTGKRRTGAAAITTMRSLLWLVVLFLFALPSAATTATTTATTTLSSSHTSSSIIAAPIPLLTQLRLAARLVTATLLGGVVGKERSTGDRAHPAGVRTLSLVALGAALWTICSAYGFTTTTSSSSSKCDPSRMASNVASGVGFIGAGVITTNSKNQESMVHGLTTAAAIWLSAAVGVGCGVGLHGLAAVATALTIAVLRVGKTQPSIIVRRRRRGRNRKQSGGGLGRTTTTEPHPPPFLWRRRPTTNSKDTSPPPNLWNENDNDTFTYQAADDKPLHDADDEMIVYRRHPPAPQEWNVTSTSGSSIRSSSSSTTRSDEGKKEP